MLEIKILDLRRLLTPLPLILTFFLFFVADTASVDFLANPPVFRSSTNLVLAPLVWFERVYVDEQFGRNDLIRESYRHGMLLLPVRESVVTPKPPLNTPSMLKGLWVFHKMLVLICVTTWAYALSSLFSLRKDKKVHRRSAS